VDELSAMCGIGGAYAENVPVFHLVNGRADTHQICPVLKVDRPCHRADSGVWNDKAPVKLVEVVR
jgi:hypothetical protein